MKVFSNFRMLIVGLVVGVLAMTALAFMFFTRSEVTRAMLAAGDESAGNILQVVDLNIENEYKNLTSFKEYATGRYRDQLKNLVGIVIQQIDSYHALYEKGVLSEEEAQRQALEAVEKLRYGNNDYFYIYDRNDVAISHPDPRIKGRNMADSTDDRGLPVLKTMRAETKADGEGTLTMYWTRLGDPRLWPKLLYCRIYEKWDWLVGTGVYIDDVETDARRKMDEIMQVLQDTFDHVKVADTGYFFVFDGQSNTLIHPMKNAADTLHMQDLHTGAGLFPELIRASADPSIPLKYYWTKPGQPSQRAFTKYSHVRHFAPLDWYIASSVYEDELQRPARRIVFRQMIFVGITVIVGIVLAVFLVSRVTRPLARLTRYAEKLQKADFALPEEESAELKAIVFPREVGRLAETMASMERRLKEYLENIRKTVAQRERLESEMRIAHEIQMNMLPKDLAGLRGRTEVDLAMKLVPAREVGGDLYDFFFVDRDRLCLVVGDVSDKGVPAALFMARSIALLRHTAVKESRVPDEIFSIVNRELIQGNDFCMFVTAFLGILNVTTGELVYSNAGHLPPLHVPASGGCRETILPPGKPLGVSERAVFRSNRLTLEPGDALAIFTDGITEAQNGQGELFDISRLQMLMKGGCRADSASALVEGILQGVKGYVGDTPQSDDIALLCVRREDGKKG